MVWRCMQLVHSKGKSLNDQARLSDGKSSGDEEGRGKVELTCTVCAVLHNRPVKYTNSLLPLWPCVR